MIEPAKSTKEKERTAFACKPEWHSPNSVMVRTLFSLALLSSFAAWAQPLNFTFTSPTGAGNRVADGGTAILTWLDGPDPDDVGRIMLFAAPPAHPGALGSIAMRVPIQLTPNGALHVNASDQFDWNTTGVKAGCYQPVAIVSHVHTGQVSFAQAQGLLAVGDTVKMPPTAWITTPSDDRPNDAGILTIHADLDVPKGPTYITAEFIQGSDVVTSPRAIEADETFTTATFELDIQKARPGISFVRLTLLTFDGTTPLCQVYWNGTVYREPTAEEIDAGFVFDGGGFIEEVDAGSFFGGIQQQPGSWGGGGACGCGSAGGAAGIAALLVTLALAPMRRERARKPR